MSSGLACPDRRGATFSRSPSGQGVDAVSSRAIDERVHKAMSSWKGPDSMAITLGQSLTDMLLLLWDTYRECSTANWDGYDARPVMRETFESAAALLKSLPTTIPMPDVAAEPGGEIGFEWRKDSSLIAVMIDGRSRLHYAAVYGRDTTHGATDFVDLLPSRIIELIAKVVR